MAIGTSEEEVLGATITTVVDNDTVKPGLGAVHGVSFHVEVQYPGRREAVLFDMCGSAQVFRHNAQALNIDFSRIEAFVISHFHRDHCGALEAALGFMKRTDFSVFLPGSSNEVERIIRNAGVRVIIASEAQKIREGVFTSGALGSMYLKEHALIINTDAKGLVILTGCAHPKVLRMMNVAKKVFPGRPVHAVIGGFHLSTKAEGVEVGKGFAKEGVKLVSPCHCTSKMAKSAIRSIVGDEVYQRNGSGTILTIK